MNELEVLWPEEKKAAAGQRIAWPAWEFPSYRTTVANDRGVSKELLFILWGGIGDQLCSEPAVRYALENFKGYTVSVATNYPEMFKHLELKDLFDTKIGRPDDSKYLVLKTITTPDDLSWQFHSHLLTHCVDFPSICAYRSQVPVAYRAVQLHPVQPTEQRLLDIIANKDKHVLIHAGKHWESKTFPVEFWNGVLQSVVDKGFTPVLIGKTVDDNVGYVDCSHEAAIDLRDQCKLNDTMWLCKNASMMICSDSSPLHMAVTGDAHIAFICSAKHQDFIYHWRRPSNYKDGRSADPIWAWRMKHFNTGGIWDTIAHCPGNMDRTVVDKCDPELLKSWLPKPEEMIEWLSQQIL